MFSPLLLMFQLLTLVAVSARGTSICFVEPPVPREFCRHPKSCTVAACETSSLASQECKEGLAQEEQPIIAEFSEHYRCDAQDLNAACFVEQLQPSDAQTLRTLMKEHFFARKQRDYDTSDQLDMTLKRVFGVRIYNDPPIWTTQKGVPPTSYLRRKRRKLQKEMKLLYGPLGHPYQHVGGPIDTFLCPLTISEVNSLLARLAMCMVDGNPEEADEVKFELLINGVHCNEELKQWRADGLEIRDLDAPTGISNAREMNLMSSTTNEEKILSPASWDGNTRDRVQQLILLRKESLQKHDFSGADFLELELAKTYNVVQDTISRTWSYSPDLDSPDLGCDDVATVDEFPCHAGSFVINILPPLLLEDEPVRDESFQYRPSIHSLTTLSDKAVARVEDLLLERCHLREEGKYLEADAIRKELWHTYYVGVNDRLRQWSESGVFDEESTAK